MSLQFGRVIMNQRMTLIGKMSKISEAAVLWQRNFTMGSAESWHGCFSMSKFIEQYADELGHVEDGWTLEIEEFRQRELLARLISLTKRDISFKAKAYFMNGKMRSQRKKVLKQLLHVFEEAYLSWGGQPDGLKAEGVRAQGILEAEIRRVELRKAVVRVATTARGTGRIANGNKAVQRMINEIRNLDRILENLVKESNYETRQKAQGNLAFGRDQHDAATGEREVGERA